jgi:hypothetical protein
LTTQSPGISKPSGLFGHALQPQEKAVGLRRLVDHAGSTLTLEELVVSAVPNTAHGRLRRAAIRSRPH